MTEALQYISNNNLASALVAAVIFAIVGGLRKWYKNYRDSKKILDFMLRSKAETNFTFRSTEVISADTKISESRVADLCSKHPKIKRNEKEKQSWRLVD